jgi:type I restriction enzyme S subunit
MGRWIAQKLNKLGHFITGSGFPADYQGENDGPFPFFKVSDLNNHENEVYLNLANNYISLQIQKIIGARIIPENSIIFAKIGEAIYLERKRIMKYTGFVDNNMEAFVGDGSIINIFLFYNFQYIKMGNFTNTTALPAIDIRFLGKYKIAYPLDTKEQSKIAEILSTIDTVIEKTKAIVEKYQRIKTGMMQDLLTNGIDENGNIRSPKTHKYKDSPIGKIPVEWEYGVLSDLAYINPKTSVNVSLDEEVDFIPMQDVSEDGVWNIKETKIAQDCMLGFTEFAENDVLFAKITPCMENGKGCIVKNLKNGKGFGSTEFHVLHPKSNSIPDFIYYWSISYFLRNKAIAYMGGSAGQQRVSTQFFDKFEIGKPPKDEQCLIANKLSAIDAKIRSEQAYLKKLQRIKQGLMKDLLTHRVAVDTLL